MKNFSHYLNLPKLDLKWPKGNPNDHQHQNTAKPDQRIRQLDGSYIGCTTYLRYPAAQEYVDWFFEQIPELKGHTGDIGWQLHQNTYDNPNGVQMTVHTDGKRGPLVISYMVSKGGDNIITRWYQEVGQPVVRPPMIGFTKEQIPYENLIELESIEIQEHQWIMFRSDILHDVKPIMTCRECFTVGFFDLELYNYIAEKYSIKMV